MGKVIAVIDRPKDCTQCVFGICKYSHPFWSREKPNTKGYYCQLLPPEKRDVQQFNYDEEVHLDKCPLVPMPERKDTVDNFAYRWNKCLDHRKEHKLTVNAKR